LFKATNGKTTTCLKPPMGKLWLLKTHQWGSDKWRVCNGKTHASPPQDLTLLLTKPKHESPLSSPNVPF